MIIMAKTMVDISNRHNLLVVTIEYIVDIFS